jgi:hypothetical protein
MKYCYCILIHPLNQCKEFVQSYLSAFVPSFLLLLHKIIKVLYQTRLGKYPCAEPDKLIGLLVVKAVNELTGESTALPGVNSADC